MKKLQNNFTTPEQSKRLLELGVPADSADQVYYEDIMWGAHEFIPNDKTYSEIVAGHENISTPCWSVGRLMEIAHICSDSTLSYKEEANKIQKFKEEHKCKTIIEAVILCLIGAVSIGSINFSKLEE